MVKTQNEVIETQRLVDDIKKIGFDRMDEGDLDIINQFITMLKPYLEMVDYTKDNLWAALKDTYNTQLFIQFNSYRFTSEELHKLIPQLESDAMNLKKHLEERNNGN